MALIKLQATFLDAIFKQDIGDPVREPCQPMLPLCAVPVLGADGQERPAASARERHRCRAVLGRGWEAARS